MSYLDAGFDQFLTKNIISTQSQQIDPLQTEELIQELSGSKVKGGVIGSSNNLLGFDLQNNKFTMTEGAVRLVTVGQKDDFTNGYIFNKKDATTIMDETGIYPDTFIQDVISKQIAGSDADHQLRLDSSWDTFRPIDQLTITVNLTAPSLAIINLYTFGATVGSWAEFRFRVNGTLDSYKTLWMTNATRSSGELTKFAKLTVGANTIEVLGIRATAGGYYQVEGIFIEAVILGR